VWQSQLQKVPASRIWPWTVLVWLLRDYRQRTRSFYIGKQLPAGVELLVEQGPVDAVGGPTLSGQ
jgi:hypothetical protein